jgi:ADP-dependent NAD(P)H-hydrate dehydratase / NAD(P)H-hydrate epimerase
VVASTVEAKNPDSLAASHARTLRAMGIRCVSATGNLDLDSEVLLDGLLGTGIQLPLREPASGLIRAINDAGRPVIAIDIPSGLDADSGAGDESAVQAVATVTLGLPKPALRTARSCGRLFLADIGLPAALFEPARPAVEALYRAGDLVELISST